MRLWWVALGVLLIMWIFLMILHSCDGITIWCIICIRWVVNIIYARHLVSVYILRVILVINGFIIIMWVDGSVIGDDNIVILGINKPIFVTVV